MIKHILITGDCHRRVIERLENIRFKFDTYRPEETAIIILGDVGINYYLDSSDRKLKKRISDYGYTLYCVRGNHEARPSGLENMALVNDNFIKGAVWVEKDFPLIKYFCDWGLYDIAGRRTLVIGGAYSVDKFYRIRQGMKWFPDEQLKDFEMDACYRNAIEYPEFDLILSHTCPYSWRPTDLFLAMIDQSTVDNTMEIWMDKLAEKLDFKIWLYGHYHADRIERPHAEIFYYETEELQAIESRWERYDKTGEIDWWIPMSPSMKRMVGKNE